ncbi:hypothetical protein [Ichthyobacterium seriolicida]|uniref:Uncharacterized protein n=1 Tax=Ichthyobacterium seriolicida TaxID=242600 RepID=A0A1J1E5J3_9FLAO|nr:hypothetical protein [Ichthyobacterium seriolicida]BAV94582.1 hypothetical protein JBKA6_0569 [Ichthyobacterium seriolicida]
MKDQLKPSELKHLYDVQEKISKINTKEENMGFSTFLALREATKK